MGWCLPSSIPVLQKVIPATQELVKQTALSERSLTVEPVENGENAKSYKK